LPTLDTAAGGFLVLDLFVFDVLLLDLCCGDLDLGDEERAAAIWFEPVFIISPRTAAMQEQANRNP
jgi:hypothetical protein